MKAGILAIAWILLGIAIAPASESTSIPLHETPKPVPEISFHDEQGNALTLEDWRGKIVALNIWATWCGPCRAEMPTLDRLQGLLGGDRFDVVALSIDRAGVGVVRRFFDQVRIENLAIFIDETGRSARDLKVFGLPATIILGPDGHELGRLVGPAEWDTPEMIDFFETLIAKHQKGT
jgi:thiol-disulfide isomerase/thioredoxin